MSINENQMPLFEPHLKKHLLLILAMLGGTGKVRALKSSFSQDMV
jgi:hypothetical protein